MNIQFTLYNSLIEPSTGRHSPDIKALSEISTSVHKGILILQVRKGIPKENLEILGPEKSRIFKGVIVKEYY